MSIPDAVIEEVRARGDLVELAAEHTTLKRSGRTFRGPCPLHGGSGPNFSVDPQRNLFHCFVCGEGGDLFAFPMKHLGMDFLEAVRYVAERAGVEIPDPREREHREEPYSELHETNAFAADWYRRQLAADGGAPARDYLERRGIAVATAERFGLGSAPEGWSSLVDAARAHGIPDERLLEVGLARRSSRDGHLYDALRGRIVFPIENLAGRVVGFGGRVLGAVEEHTPKYVNSPDSPVYHKGEILYGLVWSRGAIRRADTALVVEGYMDYVSLAAHGVENVVAPLGTALTPEQGALIARYAARAVLLYDSDKAGLRATFRSGDELLRAGVEALVATLADGEDPDSLVRAGGAAALKPHLDDAVDVLERKIQILERRDYFGSITRTRRAVDALLPTVRAASDEVLRGVYLRRISERTGVPQATLERESATAPPRDARPDGSPERRRRREGRRADDFQPVVPPNVGAERNLLLLLLRDDGWTERALREVGPDDFRHRTYRELFRFLAESEGERDAAGAWLAGLPDELLPTVEGLRSDLAVLEISAPETFFADNVRRIALRPLERRLSEARAHGGGSDADAEAFKQELNELLEIKREQRPELRPGWVRDADRRGS